MYLSDKDMGEIKTLLSVIQESGGIISYGQAFSDVKEIVTALPAEEYAYIYTGAYKNYHPMYREVLKVNNNPVAFIEIEYYKKYRSGSIGIACKPDKKYRRKGYSANLVKRAIAWANDTDSIDRLVWISDRKNNASILMARHLGFKESKELLYPNSTKDFIELEYIVNK